MSLRLRTAQGARFSYAPLGAWGKAGLLFFLLVIVAFGCLVEHRSAFRERRRTDAGVYFRAAWAVRSGADMYHVTDNNNWHYNYPPLLAILLTPLADPPAGEPRDGMLSYPVSIALWFLINLLCGLIAIHWFARAIEESSDDHEVRATPCGCRAWWARRVIPMLICLPPMVHTLARGQLNLILLLLLAGMMRSLVRGRSGVAGAWLAGAICLKIIPAFLLVYPLWRRDWRFVAGCSVALIVGLAIVPMAMLGTERTLNGYQELSRCVLLPGLTNEGDSTRAEELTNLTGTGSQSFLDVWHSTLHPVLSTRPDKAARWLRLSALFTGALLTLVTLLADSRRLGRDKRPNTEELFVVWGALLLVMLFTSPVSHMHYQALCLPLVMGLLALRPPVGRWRSAWLVLAVVVITANTLPHLPGLGQLRDFGVAMYAALGLWALGVTTLAKPAPKAPYTLSLPSLRAAA